jgi:hypothetical protein
VGATRVPLAGTLPFQPGEKYTIEVRMNGGTGPIDYRVDVNIKK